MTSMPLFSHTAAGWNPAAGPTGLARQGAAPRAASFKSDAGLAPGDAALYEGSGMQALAAWLASSCAGGVVCVHLEDLGPLECHWEATGLAVSALRPDGVRIALALPHEAWAARGGVNPAVRALWAPAPYTNPEDTDPEEGP